MLPDRARIASQDDSKITPPSTLRSPSPPVAAQPSQPTQPTSQPSQLDSGKTPVTIPVATQAGPQGQAQNQTAKSPLEPTPAYNPLTSNYLLTDLSGIISTVSQKPRTPSIETTVSFGHFQLFPSGGPQPPNGLFSPSPLSSHLPFTSASSSHSVPPRLDTGYTQGASYDPFFTPSFSPLSAGGISAPSGPSGSAHTLWNQPSLLGSVQDLFGV